MAPRLIRSSPVSRIATTMGKSDIKYTTKPDGQIAVRSCGLLLFQRQGQKAEYQFLLMKHPNRYDLPKGHQEVGETDVVTALREMNEETGIDPKIVDVSSDFFFEETYYPTYKRFGGAKVEKKVRIYIGRLKSDAQFTLNLTEHEGCKWLIWKQPPAKIQQNTIDPLLAKVAEHFATHPMDEDTTWK